MASIWDKLKALLGGAPSSAGTGAGASSNANAGNAPGGASPGVGTSNVQGPYRAPSSAPSSSAGPYRTPQNPYEAPNLLALSREEHRKRALTINPYQTAWIGRTDVIPPQSDERTALIDRGLILRGLATESELAEIHRIGDEWLRYRDAHHLVRAAALGAGQAAVEAFDRARREKRAEKRAEAARVRDEKRAAVAKRRATDLIFLGTGVSAGLADRRADVEKLLRLGLPVLATPGDVARAMGLTVPRLRWLCFHAEATDRTHYVQFTIAKRSGGVRVLSAPHRELARAQRWVLDNVLERLSAEPCAHGFVKGRSTLTNAQPHVGKALVVNLDLSDFFPTVTFVRVRGVFEGLGYSPAVATVLALLCTESPRRVVKYEGRALYVAVGPRALPQGACTSPALSNQVARMLDRRLAAWCDRHGWAYTRYADDLTFSRARGDLGAGARGLAALHSTVRSIVRAEGFVVNERKGRVQRTGRRQTVTGVVVNAKPGVPRDEVRRLRAIVHGARKTGLAAQNREGRPHFEAWLRGKIAYVEMIDRAKGAALRRALEGVAP